MNNLQKGREMEEIEVGEYVRTNTGLILKYDDENEKTFIDNFLTCQKIMKERIVKHSKQLIDLIEEGDYVNGYRVTDKYLFAGEKPVLETEGNDTNCKCLCEKDIKTILTKEQMEANCYKVGGEDG